MDYFYLDQKVIRIQKILKETLKDVQVMLATGGDPKTIAAYIANVLADIKIMEDGE